MRTNLEEALSHIEVKGWIVEGQADALTLGQWGVAAVALVGVQGGDDGAHTAAASGCVPCDQDTQVE